jgi:hypothetical protein
MERCDFGDRVFSTTTWCGRRRSGGHVGALVDTHDGLVAPRNDVIATAEHGIQRICDTHHLAFSVLGSRGLSLW